MKKEKNKEKVTTLDDWYSLKWHGREKYKTQWLRLPKDSTRKREIEREREREREIGNVNSILVWVGVFLAFYRVETKYDQPMTL